MSGPSSTFSNIPQDAVLSSDISSATSGGELLNGMKAGDVGQGGNPLAGLPPQAGGKKHRKSKSSKKSKKSKKNKKSKASKKSRRNKSHRR